MDRYLIETPHDAVDCHMILNELQNRGYLYNFEWGCADGVHCGWAIVEAESEQQARMIVPSVVRKDARIVRLLKFDMNEAGEIHSVKSS
jgi:hypothetical protein